MLYILSNDFVKDKSIYCLLTVFVIPEYHKKDVGKILLEKLEENARELNAKKLLLNHQLQEKTFTEN